MKHTRPKHNKAAPSNELLIAVNVVRQCDFAIKMDNLNLWSVNKSVARAKRMRSLSEISTDIGVSNRLDAIFMAHQYQIQMPDRLIYHAMWIMKQTFFKWFDEDSAC